MTFGGFCPCSRPVTGLLQPIRMCLCHSIWFRKVSESSNPLQYGPVSGATEIYPCKLPDSSSWHLHAFFHLRNIRRVSPAPAGVPTFSSFHLSRPSKSDSGFTEGLIREIPHFRVCFRSSCRRNHSMVPVQKRDLQKQVSFNLEVPPRFELGNEGFADLCLTTWPRYHIKSGTPLRS